VKIGEVVKGGKTVLADIWCEFFVWGNERRGEIIL
jgi:hypothetical protein